MNLSGLKSFVSGFIWIGIGAFLFIEGYKTSASFSVVSFASFGGIAALMYGSLLLLTGFVTNAKAPQKLSS